MAFTYSGNPADSNLDRLRFELGDVESTSVLLNNDEINFCISQQPTWNRRIAMGLRSIGNKIMRQPNFRLDRWTENRHDVAKLYLSEAAALEKSSITSMGVWAGSTSTAWKNAQKDEADYNEPFAAINSNENPTRIKPHDGPEQPNTISSETD